MEFSCRPPSTFGASRAGQALDGVESAALVVALGDLPSGGEVPGGTVGAFGRQGRFSQTVEGVDLTDDRADRAKVVESTVECPCYLRVLAEGALGARKSLGGVAGALVRAERVEGMQGLRRQVTSRGGPAEAQRCFGGAQRGVGREEGVGDLASQPEGTFEEVERLVSRGHGHREVAE